MGQALITPSRRLIVGPRGFRKPARPMLDPGHPLNRGLVGCWLLGDRAGNGLFKDLSTGGNNGTGSGSPTLAASHHGGLASSFANASSQYVDLGAARLTNVGAAKVITVSVWVKLASNAAGSLNAIVANGTGANACNWELRKLDTTHFDFFSWDGVTYSAISVAPSFTTGVWYHLVGQWIGASPWYLFYFNGAAQSGSTSNATVGPLGGTSHGYIGVEPGISRYWDGTIDGVRVYNRVLSASEVAQLFAEPYAGIVEQAPRWRVALVGGTVTITLGQASWVWTGFAVGVNSKTMIALGQNAWAWTGQALSINAKTMITMGQNAWRWGATAIGGVGSSVIRLLQLLGVGP